MQSPLPPKLQNGSQVSNTQAQYTFDVAKTEEFLMKKLITFPQDHQFPIKEDLRGKVYCTYRNSWNHILMLVRVSGILFKTISIREY